MCPERGLEKGGLKGGLGGKARVTCIRGRGRDMGKRGMSEAKGSVRGSIN